MIYDISFCAMPRDCKKQNTCRRANWKEVPTNRQVSMADLYEFDQNEECRNYYPGPKHD